MGFHLSAFRLPVAPAGLLGRVAVSPFGTLSGPVLARRGVKPRRMPGDPALARQVRPREFAFRELDLGAGATLVREDPAALRGQTIENCTAPRTGFSSQDSSCGRRLAAACTQPINIVAADPYPGTSVAVFFLHHAVLSSTRRIQSLAHREKAEARTEGATNTSEALVAQEDNSGSAAKPYARSLHLSLTWVVRLKDPNATAGCLALRQ